MQSKCEYVIPQFQDINKTYFPFTRHDHWDNYEVSLKIYFYYLPLKITLGACNTQFVNH